MVRVDVTDVPLGVRLTEKRDATLGCRIPLRKMVVELFGSPI